MTKSVPSETNGVVGLKWTEIGLWRQKLLEPLTGEEIFKEKYFSLR
jgi:hypothetical protein